MQPLAKVTLCPEPEQPAFGAAAPFTASPTHLFWKTPVLNAAVHSRPSLPSP